MASVFKMIDEHTCEGCARKIKNCVKKLKGVESAEVKERQDINGNDEFTIIVKGSFDPQKIITVVEIKVDKRIELVSDKINQVKPIEANVELLKNLKQLASNNLGKAQKLTEVTNECETLKGQLQNAWARQNELARQKRDILNRDRPNATLPQSSRRGKPKKEDESEVMYGKLASKKMKLEDFVHKYKLLQFKKHTKITT